MAQPNLLKIDDLLLRAGAILGVLWVFGSLVAIAIGAESGKIGAALLGVAACATAPIGILAGGFKLRRREKRAWALARLVDDHVELPASELLRDSDFTSATLERAIRDLNSAGAAFLVWDRDADVVQDGRLRAARVLVDDCPSCGGKVSLRLQLGDLSSTRCPYCQSPLDSQHLLEERARLIDELETPPTRLASPEESNFSLGVFIVLTVIFWPFGLGYAIWHWHAAS